MKNILAKLMRRSRQEKQTITPVTRLTEEGRREASLHRLGINLQLAVWAKDHEGGQAILDELSRRDEEFWVLIQRSEYYA